ncbi:hypothetical protein FCJ60_04250 [Burkholderia metallica]|nr:hypothetical protein [Burkholderia metallica]
MSFIVGVVSVIVALSHAVVDGGPMPCRPRTSEYERGLAFHNSHWTHWPATRQARARRSFERRGTIVADRAVRIWSHATDAARPKRRAEAASRSGEPIRSACVKRRRPEVHTRTPGHRSTANAGLCLRCPAPAHRSTRRDLHQN